MVASCNIFIRERLTTRGNTVTLRELRQEKYGHNIKFRTKKKRTTFQLSAFLSIDTQTILFNRHVQAV